MSISIPAETVYLPCYYRDSATGNMALGKYNYTETLKKAAKGAKDQTQTYWVPDEYGRVLIDPNCPRTASLETSPSDIQLPAASYSLPSGGKAEKTNEKEEERKAQEERLRIFREECKRMAQQEALLRRLAQSILTTERAVPDDLFS